VAIWPGLAKGGGAFFFEINVGFFTDAPAEFEDGQRPCVGIASHCDRRCGEGRTDVWNVSDACLEWPGRFGDEWTMGADYRQRAICGDAGKLVWGECVPDGDNVPEYRELSYDEYGIRVGRVSSEESIRWRAR
jgi:hypothetical protein